MKKIFIISSSLLVLVIIFFIAYNIAFKKSDNGEKENPVGLFEEKGSGSVSEAKIKPITEEAVTGVFLDRKKEKINFYSASNGKTWQMGLRGEKIKNISSDELVGLQDAVWSPDGGKSISIFNQGNGQKNFFLYDYAVNKSTRLKSGFDRVAWDNTGGKIIYKYFEESTGAKSINIADPDGSNWKKLADTRFRDVIVAPIPQTALVSFWNNGKAQEETELVVVGLNGGEAKKIFSGKFGADYKWSPNGEKAAVSYLKEGGITTGLVDINGAYMDLGIPTMVSKMEWSLDNEHIYYALPIVPAGAIMPDDHKTNKISTTDTFWKINIKNGEKTRLLELGEIDGAYDAVRITLSPSEDALFFVNKTDGKIYRLDF